MAFRVMAEDEAIPKRKAATGRPKGMTENAKIALALRAGQRVEIARTKPKGKLKNRQSINLRSAMIYRGIRVHTVTTEKHIYLTYAGEIDKPESTYILKRGDQE